MFKNACVGERVYSTQYGYGKIHKIFDEVLSCSFKHPNFDNDTLYLNYRIDGRKCKYDVEPTLFWDKPKYNIPVKCCPFKKDQLILALNDEMVWIPVKFIKIDYVTYLVECYHYNGNNKIINNYKYVSEFDSESVYKKETLSYYINGEDNPTMKDVIEG